MNTSLNAQMSGREWTLLIVLSILWGGSFFFVETLVDNLRPLTIVALRVGLAAPALWLVAVVMGNRLPSEPRVWLAFLVMGVINNVIPFSLLVYGQTGIASGVASILNATTPMFTVLVAGVLLADERITAPKIAGVVAGFAGVAVMMGPGLLFGAGGDVAAQIACLGAAVSYAFAAAYGRRFKRLGVAPTMVAAGQVTASALVLTPLALIVDAPLAGAMPGADVWIAVFALALLSTSLAYIIYFRLLATAGATRASGA